jgi:uncharacterized membrane protein
MCKKYALLIKSTLWEVLSAILGFTIVYIFTGELSVTFNITMVLLVLKSILLAVYDYYATKFINKFN